MQKLSTVGQLAQVLGVPIHRVRYIVQTRSIASVSRAGMYHMYDTEAVLPLVREELNKMHANESIAMLAQ